ncbi:MAG: hypothetical protein FJX57_07820, partial [Alphaproteobacteria bacterium]|nr:hypothetical protein [Alphaproteobacteria bacterium]
MPDGTRGDTARERLILDELTVLQNVAVRDRRAPIDGTGVASSTVAGDDRRELGGIHQGSDVSFRGELPGDAIRAEDGPKAVTVAAIEATSTDLDSGDDGAARGGRVGDVADPVAADELAPPPLVPAVSVSVAVEDAVAHERSTSFDPSEPPPAPTGASTASDDAPAGATAAGIAQRPASSNDETDLDLTAEAPRVVAGPAIGYENQPITLSLAASLVDTDGSESLSIVIAGVPPGAILSAGVDKGDGTWTVAPAELSGLVVTPPAGSDADFTLTVMATATESSTGDRAVTTLMVPVSIIAVADAPTLSTAVAAGAEDSAIALSITTALADTDGSETLAITVSGVPSGATLSAGTNAGGGVWTLTPGQLAGLSITPPANSDGDFTLTVVSTATEADGGDTARTTASIAVTVAAVADQPLVTLGVASGTEEAPIALPITVTLADTDGSESLAIVISGVPLGVVLSAGTNNHDGTWSLTPAQLTGLTASAPANDDTDFTLTIVATSTEADGGDTASRTATLAVSIAGDADAPSLSTSAASGTEDMAIALSITSALTDTDGSETLSIVIGGVPAGAVLSAGTDNGDGTWTLTPGQLAGLTITPPSHSDADFTLTVVSTTTEADGGDT